jgi:uncharacterized protein (TIGR00159 family)
MTVVNEILSWRGLLDIFLMSAGIFFLYRTLLSLGTWKIVTGILLAIIVFLLASLLDLKGITWIYRNVSHVALIAVIVIFQPELRKIFERATFSRRARAISENDRLAEQIANALWRLARRKQGAIIVIPGKDPLKEWLSGGIPLNGIPSEPLIMSIFDPNSPGHDGAMILEYGRVTLFGVRLPISQSSRLSEEYGTRHHAAMGLSERSDALVLVSSEERGRISIFKGGELIAAPEAGVIIQAITRYWRETSSLSLGFSEGRPRRRIIGQMAASIVIALLIWTTLVFDQSERVETIITAPVQYTLSSENLVLVGERPDEVRLHVSGSMSEIDRLTPAQLNVLIDISDAREGRQTFYITENNLHLPRGVKLLDVSPPSLELTLAAISRKNLPIDPQLVGKLGQGLALKSVNVQPGSIEVLIPAREGKDRITNITTTPVYLENIREDTRILCKIIAPPSIQPVDKRWPDVEINISVNKKETETRQ